MASCSIVVKLSTTEKQILVDKILDLNEDWESYLTNNVEGSTEPIIKKINEVLSRFGGRASICEANDNLDLDPAFENEIYNAIDSVTNPELFRSETQSREKPDINISFDPWDAGGKTRVTDDFSKTIASRVVVKVNHTPDGIRLSCPVRGDVKARERQIAQVMFDYKIQLIRTIKNFLNSGSVDANPTITDSAFTRMIEETLTEFENYKAGLNEEDKTNIRDTALNAIRNRETSSYMNANDAYVTLKYFDFLLSDVGFARSKKAYQGTDMHGYDMYVYEPPKAAMIKSWGADEIQGVDKHASNIFKLITQNIPCINDRGEVIPGMFVEEAGFRGIMEQFRRWLATSNDGQSNGYDASLDNGNIEGLSMAFDEFVKQNLGQSDFTINPKYKVKYPNQLRGLQAMFNSTKESELLDFLPTMWSYVKRTVGVEYSMYTKEKGSLKTVSAQYRLVQIQTHKILDSISYALYNNEFIQNKKFKDQINDKFGVKFGEDEIILFSGTNHEIRIKKDFSGKEKKWKIEYVIKDGSTSYTTGDDTGLDVKIGDEIKHLSVDNDTINKEITPLIESVAGIIPDNWRNFTSGNNLADLYCPLIGVVLDAMNNEDNYQFTEYDNSFKVLDPYASGIINSLQSLSEFYAASRGSDLAITLKDLNGNSIPAFGLTSFQYNIQQHKNKLIEEINEYNKDRTESEIHFNALENNFVYEKMNWIGQEIIRNTVRINGRVRSSRQLSDREVTYLAVISDFATNLFDENKNSVMFQNTTNSDKSTHPIIPYAKSLPISDNLTLGQALNHIITDPEKRRSSKQHLINTLFNSRRGEYTNIAKSLINDYNKALGIKLDTDNVVESIDRLQALLYTRFGNNAGDIKRLFKEKGVQFDEEVHFSKGSVNHELFAEIRIYCGNNEIDCRSKFNKHIQEQLEYMVKDMEESGLTLNTENREILDLVKRLPDPENWVDTTTGDVALYRIVKDSTGTERMVINPILEAFGIGDVLCSSEYNKMTFGFSFIHPNKAGMKSEKLVDQIKDGQMVEYMPDGFPAYIGAQGNLIKSNANGLFDLETGNKVENYLVVEPDQVETVLEAQQNGDPTLVDKTIVQKMYVPSDEYIVQESASRLASSYKRTVIGGATITPYLPMDNGVGKYFKYIVVQDLKGTVWNMMGNEDKKLDSMDGSMLASPIFSRLAQVSCTDAAVGYDSKTIMGDLSASFGKPILFKSAEYALTNDRRRVGSRSDASIENLFYKMHSLPIDFQRRLEEYYNYTLYNKAGQDKPIFFKSPYSGKHYKVSDLRTEREGRGTRVTYKLTEVNEFGEKLSGTQSIEESRMITCLYDIDQIFGGAYSESFNEDTGKLEYSEANIDMLTEIVCDNNMKEDFLSYIVNMSANKVGASNVMSSDFFNKDFGMDENGVFDSSKLWVSRASTQGLGVQMDPNHELDFSSVTEMSQMISALIQGGHFTKFVNQIYAEIGKVAAESMKQVDMALNSDDEQKVYKILGESLMRSFETGNRSTIGLAQSFIMRARIALEQGNYNYKIPFSAATINSMFIADVISNLNKKGIRRKYAGIAAVLVPSHNMMQYYRGDTGEPLLFEDYISEFRKKYIAPNEISGLSPRMADAYIARKFDLYSSQEFIQNADGTEVPNPTLKEIKPWDVDIEDTIVLVDKTTGERKVEKMDSWRKLDMIRNLISSNQYTLYNWTIKPKNLRQADIRFTDSYGTTRSMYDLDAVRANYYLDDLNEILKNKKRYSALPNSERVTLTSFTDNPEYGTQKSYVTLNAINSIIARLTDYERTYYGFDGFVLTADTQLDGNLIKRLKELCNVETQKQLNNINTNQKVDYQYGWDLVQEIQSNGVTISYPITEGDKAHIGHNITNVNTRFAEIMMGKLHAKELGLDSASLAEIERLKDTYFKRNASARLSVEPVADFNSGKSNLCDFTVLTRTGDTIYVSVDAFHKEKAGSKYKLDNKVCTNDSNGLWINKEIQLCDSIQNAKVKTIRNAKGESCPLLIVEELEDLDELFNSENVAVVKSNFCPENAQKLLDHNGGIKPITYYNEDFDEVTISVKDIESTLKKSDDDQVKIELCKVLQNQFNEKLDTELQNLALEQYQAFEQQLYFIGARIPTQSMQSFQALKVVGYTNDTTGKVYVPKVQTWLQGSDYDIDKLYMLSFSINSDGTLPSFSRLIHRGPIIENITSLMSLNQANGVKYYEHDPSEAFRTGKIDYWNGEHARRVEGSDNWDLRDGLHVIFNDNGSCTLKGVTAKNAKESLRKLKMFFDEIGGIPNNINFGEETRNASFEETFIKRLRINSANNIYTVTVEDVEGVNKGRKFDCINTIMESTSNKVNFAPGISEDQKKTFLRFLNIHTNGKTKFARVETDDADFVTHDEVQAIINGDKRVINRILKKKNHNIRKTDTTLTSDFEHAIEILNKIQFDRSVKQKNRESALQNSVAARILSLLKNPSIQMYGHDPISLDNLGGIAKKLTGSSEGRLTMDNAYHKYMMQFQNMVGKDVVGIAAVGMKVFFAVSDYANAEIDAIEKAYENIEDDKVAEHLLNLLFVDASDGAPKVRTLANLNFQPLLDLIKKNGGDYEIDLTDIEMSGQMKSALAPYMNDTKLSLKELLEGNENNTGLIMRSKEANAAMNISEFLSAATDNAKELILSKINGGVDFADMWTYLMMTGHSLQDCARIMTSRFFKVTSQLATSYGMDSISDNVGSKEIIKFLGLRKQLHTIKTPALKYLQRGFIDGKDYNNCFLLKMRYETINGKLATYENGVKVPLAGEYAIEDLLGTNGKPGKLIPRKNVPTFYKYTPETSYVVQEINDAYIFAAQDPNGKVMENDSDFWLTSPLACDIFEEHLRSKISKKSWDAFLAAQRKFDGDYDEDFNEEFESYEEPEYEEDESYPDDIDENGEEAEEYHVRQNDKFDENEEIPRLIRYIKMYLKPRANLFAEINAEAFNTFNDVIDNVMPGVEEQSIVGALLKINQGMQTNAYDFYAKLMRIENFINRKYLENNVEIDDQPAEFDIEQFIKDQNYAKQHIELYNRIKTFVNPLAIIKAVPNFAKMFEIQGEALDLLSRSAQWKLDWKIARSIITNEDDKANRTQQLNADQFKAMHNGIRDSLIMSWISSMELKITIPPSGRIFLLDRGDIMSYNVKSNLKNGIETESGTEIELNSIETCAAFKNMIEKIFVPKLKEMFPNNAFVKAIEGNIGKNKLYNAPVSNLRMSIDMSTADDSPVTKALYNQIQGDFMQISTNKDFARQLGIGDYSVGDLIYLYNLITYKDSFGQDSFTRLFERTNIYNTDSLVNKFYEFISNIDYNSTEIRQDDNGWYAVDKDGNKLPFEINKNNILMRLAIVPDQNNRLHMKAVYNDSGALSEIMFTDKYGEEDINKGRLSVYCADPSNFTMMLPFSTDGLNVEHYKGLDVKAYVLPNSRSVMGHIYDTLYDLCDNLGISVFHGGVDEIMKELEKDNVDIDRTKNSRDLKRLSSAKGFVINGKIYLNESATFDPDDPVMFHELSHILCASMKFSKNKADKDMYYTLINTTFNNMLKNEGTKTLEKIAYNLGFLGKNAIRLSDFKEELFVNEMARVLKLGITKTVFNGGGPKETTDLDLKNEIKSKIVELLGLDSNSIDDIDLTKLGNSKPEEVLAIFGSKLGVGQSLGNIGMLITQSSKLKGLKQILLNSDSESFNLDIDCK